MKKPSKKEIEFYYYQMNNGKRFFKIKEKISFQEWRTRFIVLTTIFSLYV